MTAEQRFATDWKDAEVRMHREGKLFQLEISIETDTGYKRYFVRVDDLVANGLREIWLTR